MPVFRRGPAGIGALLIALAAAPAPAHVREGQPAPAFTVTRYDGQRTDSAALRGQVVLINRWATWCTPCRVELPALDGYYRAHAGEGLRIIAVSTRETAKAEQVAAIGDTLAFPLARSLKGPGFGEIGGLPTSYVIDRRGVVRHVLADTLDVAKLDRFVGPLLAEPAPTP
jgi:cytochrome c biogenesis protein CcmG/thiol:disulfide interchange protein DsbE